MTRLSHQVLLTLALLAILMAGLSDTGAQTPTAAVAATSSADQAVRLTEARARWDAMSPEEQALIRDRWTLFKALPETEQQRAVQVYETLMGYAQDTAADAATGTTDTEVETAVTIPWDDRREHVREAVAQWHSHDEWGRERLRSLHADFQWMRRRDPIGFQHWHGLPPAEQRDMIARCRLELSQARVTAVAEALSLDEAEAEALLALFLEQQERQDGIYHDYFEGLARVMRQVETRIRGIVPPGTEIGARGPGDRRPRDGAEEIARSVCGEGMSQTPGPAEWHGERSGMRGHWGRDRDQERRDRFYAMQWQLVGRMAGLSADQLQQLEATRALAQLLSEHEEGDALIGDWRTWLDAQLGDYTEPSQRSRLLMMLAGRERQSR